MEYIFFCPVCQAYLSAALTSCPVCDWGRPKWQSAPAPGQPEWRAKLGGPIRSRAVVAGPLVIFAWGSREGPGGVTALNRRTGEAAWQVETPYPVEGGVTISGGQLLFGTVGFVRRGAELYCLRWETGAADWPTPATLSGGVWYAPLVVENLQLVFAATDDGQLQGFDLKDGRPVKPWPQRLPRGRHGLLLTEREVLIAVSEVGQISAFHLRRGDLIWQMETGGKITSAPAKGQGIIYFGLEGGQLAALDLQTHALTSLAGLFKRISAQPVCAEGMVYASGHDRTLRALDLGAGKEKWRQDFERSVNTSPALAEGLLFVGANNGQVYALESTTGAFVWQFATAEGRPVTGSAALDEDTVFIGAEDGCVYALPLYLGRYPWAAERLAAQRNWREAALYFALAADYETHDLFQRRQFCDRAIEMWREAGEPEKAAYFLASLLDADLQKTADLFKEAGQLWQARDRDLAANLLRRAAEYYADAGQTESEHSCEQMAARAARAPYLSLNAISLPLTWEAEAPQNVVLELKNRGNSAAQTIRVRLGGTLGRRL